MNDRPMNEMQIVIRVRRIDVAALVSVLLHLAFFVFMPHKVVSEPPGPIVDAPMNVVLAPPQVAPPDSAPESAPVRPPAAAARPTPPPPMIARTPSPLAPKFPTPPPGPAAARDRSGVVGRAARGHARDDRGAPSGAPGSRGRGGARRPPRGARTPQRATCRRSPAARVWAASSRC
jgi:hypothetical protein